MSQSHAFPYKKGPTGQPGDATSAIGPTGPDGSAGADGPQGEPGEDNIIPGPVGSRGLTNKEGGPFGSDKSFTRKNWAPTNGLSRLVTSHFKDLNQDFVLRSKQLSTVLGSTPPNTQSKLTAAPLLADNGRNYGKNSWGYELRGGVPYGAPFPMGIGPALISDEIPDTSYENQGLLGEDPNAVHPIYILDASEIIEEDWFVQNPLPPEWERIWLRMEIKCNFAGNWLPNTFGVPDVSIARFFSARLNTTDRDPDFEDIPNAPVSVQKVPTSNLISNWDKCDITVVNTFLNKEKAKMTIKLPPIHLESSLFEKFETGMNLDFRFEIQVASNGPDLNITPRSLIIHDINMFLAANIDGSPLPAEDPPTEAFQQGEYTFLGGPT